MIETNALGVFNRSIGTFSTIDNKLQKKQADPYYFSKTKKTFIEGGDLFYQQHPTEKDWAYGTLKPQKEYKRLSSIYGRSNKCVPKSIKDDIIKLGFCYLKPITKYKKSQIKGLGEAASETVAIIENYNPCQLLLQRTCDCPIDEIFNNKINACIPIQKKYKEDIFENLRNIKPQTTNIIPEPEIRREEKGNEIISEEEGEDNSIMLVGGILAAVVIAGGIMYYSSTKKKGKKK